MNNIILIGMPGVGKSTLGVVLAKVLGYRFMDTDLVIQEAQNKLLSEIIDEFGIEEFIQIENRIVSNVYAEKTVIATGGSIIYGKDAMANLKKLGKIIYIKQDFERIEKRVQNIHGRGVVLKLGQSFRDLYNERIVLYEKYADIIVDQGSQDVEQTLEVLLRRYSRNF